jgi:uncharacterized membrane protein YeaQ/YmgE (transglycosylase-associated protein family)
MYARYRPRTGGQRFPPLAKQKEYGMNFIIMLIVGGIAGWLASIIMRRDGSQGILLNVIVGIIGGLLGGWLLPMLGFNLGGWIGYLITALIGAVVLLLIVNLFTRGRAR